MRRFRATLASAQARRALAEAKVLQTRAQAERYKPLGEACWDEADLASRPVASLACLVSALKNESGS